MIAPPSLLGAAEQLVHDAAATGGSIVEPPKMWRGVLPPRVSAHALTSSGGLPGGVPRKQRGWYMASRLGEPWLRVWLRRPAAPTKWEMGG